jgi:hypothetical protein
VTTWIDPTQSFPTALKRGSCKVTEMSVILPD